MTVTAAPSPRKTEAWVPQLKVKIKRQSKSLDETRPLTATLERPLILDIALLKKLDMTTFTKKGLVTISKLCGVSLIKKDSKRTTRSVKSRKHLKKQTSIDTGHNRTKKERLKKFDTSAGFSSCDDESSVVELKRKVRTTSNELRVRRMPTIKVSRSEDLKKEDDSWFDEESSASDVITKRKSDRKTVNSLNRIIKDDRLAASSTKTNKSKDYLKRNATVDDVFGGPLRYAVPEPCKTCGRNEQPERFHSHPKTPSKTSDAQKAVKSMTTKTEISKPVPAKYKSAEKGRRESGDSRGDTTKRNLVSKEKEKPSEVSRPVRPSSGRPRTITCYLCAREFGTASFPLHEVRCIEKWERENARLPPDMRRKLPEKPSGLTTVEEWNNFAWKVAQESLVPCGKCGRTFNPDRIQVHVKVCKEQGGKTWPSFKIESDGASETPERPSTGARPPTVICYICGREFGSKSIGIHEPQCLKKWNVENDKLPEDKRRPEPVRPGKSFFPSLLSEFQSNSMPR